MRFTNISNQQQKPPRFVRPCLLLLLLFVAFGQVGCARSLRQDASQIAQQGSTTSDQMGDYYLILRSRA